MNIPISKIINVDVQMPAQYVLKCRMKAFEELPEHYMCCAEKIALLKRVSAQQKITIVYANKHRTMQGYCTFCEKPVGMTKLLYCVEGDRKVIPVDQYDISEELVQWERH